MARKRKKGKRKPNRSIFIFCEGKKTEPAYLNALIASLSFPGELATVKVINSEKTDLVGLVNEAKLHKENSGYSLDEDEYWVVVDKNGYTEHAKGFNTAKGSSIKIAFSSICFEYWLYCHFQYSTAAHGKCEDVIKKALKVHITDYEKAAKNIYAITADKLDVAVSNAKKGRKHWVESGDGRKIYDRNPYTDVDKLVLALKKYKKELENKTPPA